MEYKNEKQLLKQQEVKGFKHDLYESERIWVKHKMVPRCLYRWFIVKTYLRKAKIQS